jgi:hypothetical protein
MAKGPDKKGRVRSLLDELKPRHFQNRKGPETVVVAGLGAAVTLALSSTAKAADQCVAGNDPGNSLDFTDVTSGLTNSVSLSSVGSDVTVVDIETCGGSSFVSLTDASNGYANDQIAKIIDPFGGAQSLSALPVSVTAPKHLDCQDSLGLLSGTSTQTGEGVMWDVSNETSQMFSLAAGEQTQVFAVRQDATTPFGISLDSNNNVLHLWDVGSDGVDANAFPDNVNPTEFVPGGIPTGDWPNTLALHKIDASNYQAFVLDEATGGLVVFDIDATSPATLSVVPTEVVDPGATTGDDVKVSPNGDYVVVAGNNSGGWLTLYNRDDVSSNMGVLDTIPMDTSAWAVFYSVPDNEAIWFDQTTGNVKVAVNWANEVREYDISTGNLVYVGAEPLAAGPYGGFAIVVDGGGPALDLDGDGVNAPADCDDGNSAVYPGAPETCDDAVDSDCEGTDNGGATIGLVNTYIDGDGDGEALDGAVAVEYCPTDAPSNTLLVPGADCDDANALVNSSATEILSNGIDDDCNPATSDLPADPDNDLDGYPASADCDDNNAAVNPGQPEITLNSVDDDCDPSTLDDPDQDNDGYNLSVDCDDLNAAVNPGVTEVLSNGIDDDCDPATSDIPADPDADLDGFPASVDCDDGNAAINPAAPETCDDGIDSNCDLSDNAGATVGLLGYFPDSDGDGDAALGALATDYCPTDAPANMTTTAGADCDDGNVAVSSLNTEIQGNGIDDDCDPGTSDLIPGPECTTGDVLDGNTSLGPDPDVECDTVYLNGDNTNSVVGPDGGPIVADTLEWTADGNDGGTLTLGDLVDLDIFKDDGNPAALISVVVDNGPGESAGISFTHVGVERTNEVVTFTMKDEGDGLQHCLTFTTLLQDLNGDIVLDEFGQTIEVAIPEAACVENDAGEVVEQVLSFNSNTHEMLPASDQEVIDNIDAAMDSELADVDLDEDGFTENEGDCDDYDPNVNPDAEEILEDGIDNDCDSSTPDVVEGDDDDSTADDDDDDDDTETPQDDDDSSETQDDDDSTPDTPGDDDDTGCEGSGCSMVDSNVEGNMEALPNLNGSMMMMAVILAALKMRSRRDPWLK